MEAVRRLRDVMILTVFVLSIFALVGLQIYQGALKYKCIKVHPDPFWWTHNATEDDKMEYYLNETNWWMISPSNAQVCGLAADAGKCPDNYTCVGVGRNPNYGYTNFDNFGWAMLCAFRLMTQDYWEDLYQLIIRAMGPWHMCFFVLVILLGSFYLVNLILAIVAMSYDEQHKQDQEDMEEEEEANNALAEERAAAEKALLREELGRSPSAFSGQIFAGREAASLIELEQQVRRVSIINKQGIKESLSLPPSPHNLRRSSQFSWGGGRKKIRHPSPRLGESDAVPLFPFPGLDNLDLPWIDSSNAATPTSEDLCNWSNTHGYVNQRRRLSSTSHSSRMSMLESRFGMDRRRNSAASQRSHGHMRNPHGFYNRHIESTHFAFPRPRGHPLVPEVRLDRTRLDDNESSSDGSECDTKSKLFADNPFIYRTPSATTVDHRDVMVLQDIFNTVAMGKKRRSFEGMSKKDYIKMKLQVLIDTCECPSWWHKFAHIIELIILDAFVDLFITLCIVINTIFMAMDHAGMSAQLAHTLSVGNYVFTAIFTLEAVLKIIALGPVLYLKDKWNCFDVVIVFLSLVELGLSTVKGLSILRSFRLLRVFKLAKSWPTLNLLIGIIGRTMGALGNLCFVLLIIVFIFAVMGMQLFGGNYTLKWFPEVPRWNFTDFLHSFMIVFRVLCGEWIESMWDCIHCSGYICVPFFLLTMIIGNLVVLNLFLALLLSSFGAENLQQSQDDGETNKLQEAVDRINRFTQYVKSHVLYCIKVKICKRHMPIDEFDPTITRTDLTSKEYLDGGLPMRNGKVREADLSPEGDDDVTHKDLRILTLRLVKGTSKAHVGYSPVSPYEPNDEDCEVCQGSTRPASCGSCSTIKISKVSSRDSKLSSSESESTKSGSEVSIISESRYSYSREDTESLNKPIDSEGLEISEVNVIFVREPDECCPRCCVKRLPCIDQFAATKCGRVWWSMRCYMYKLVEHKYFETFIIFCIVASSLALAIEDVYLPERPTLKLVLMYMDKVFTVIFVVEMLIKWSAYGFKKYFTDAWCWLDFVIVAISLIMLGAEGAGLANMGAFRALRTLRALRPLRAVSRWEGMKVVVNALIQAIPSICNVLLVCLVFWLIFSIMGVQMFGGRFYACVDAEGNRVNASLVPNVTVCNLLKESHNFSWERPDVNFDDALTAYLALLQIATFKGWVQIMEDAIDSQSTIG